MLQTFKTMILSAALGSCFPVFADTPQPYASIRALPATPYHLGDAWVLLNKVQSYSTNVFVDVGSPDGAAARPHPSYQR